MTGNEQQPTGGVPAEPRDLVAEFNDLLRRTLDTLQGVSDRLGKIEKRQEVHRHGIHTLSKFVA